MGVVGGLVFASLLWMFSLISPIAWRWPVKKIAAVGALLALAAYLIISGFSAPALRSFIMASPSARSCSTGPPSPCAVSRSRR